MKVLIAEDDRVSQRLLEALLRKWGYDVVVAADGEEAWRLLEKEDPPRLAILDWMMPGRAGDQICRDLRARNKEPYIYVIMLTAKGKRKDLIEGLEAGADDYLTKPFDPHELRSRLRAGCRIVELQEQLIATREALRKEATHDGLTGLWNRAAIFEILQRELARTGRQGTRVAVILMDLDHFKSINDTYGHLVGDAVLREATRRMRASLRAYDALARFGGEEFMLVSPGCDVAGALRQAERLRSLVAEKAIETFEGAVAVTASFGVAVGDGTMEADALVRAADTALYQAKHLGRSRVQLATAGMLVGPGALLSPARGRKGDS